MLLLINSIVHSRNTIQSDSSELENRFYLIGEFGNYNKNVNIHIFYWDKDKTDSEWIEINSIKAKKKYQISFNLDYDYLLVFEQTKKEPEVRFVYVFATDKGIFNLEVYFGSENKGILSYNKEIKQYELSITK